MLMDKNIKLLILGLTGLLVLCIVVVGAIVILSSAFGGGTVAVVPIQGEIAYSSSDILGGDVANPDVIKNEINHIKFLSFS